MKVDIITLFPEMFKGPFDESIINRAKVKKLVDINIHNLRDWATDKHKTVDDRPFSGGVGMILKVDVMSNAITSLKQQASSEIRGDKNTKWSRKRHRLVLMDAGGKKFDQKKAEEYSKLDYLQLVTGHYEGVDYRVHEHLVDEVISIGDFVLTGGEIPAMAVTDAVVRLIPGVLEKPEATQFESFSPYTIHHSPITRLEHPQYTRPADFQEWKVPEVLLSGNHKEIKKWQEKKAIEITKKNRPDLIR